jgi:DNA-3-methyladenine glycosylase I
MPKPIVRCAWTSSPLMDHYHDSEWGVPCFDERALFEAIVLDGMQAGLSWQTVLKKREAFRRALADFDVKKVAQFGDADIERLLGDAAIIRNRQKILASISNAQAFIATQKEQGSFARYIWSFTDGKPLLNKWSTMHEVPAETELARVVSKDLLRRGFKFVGPTITYAFLQAIGVVNDHTTDCFRYRQVGKERR